jgi:predicted Rossmann fold flavoprotein
MTAGISAGRAGAAVLLLEKMPRLGKKILATGGGRCNFMNERLSPAAYNPEALPLVKSVLAKFGKEAILGFFKELGLEFYAEEGRMFPVTNQAATVADLLELELNRLGIPVRCGVRVERMIRQSDGWSLRCSEGRTFTAKRVVLCGGGKSYPSLGADGGAYELALKLGHRLVEPVPSTVALEVSDPWCHRLQGQRIFARVTSHIGGKPVRSESGELLFTKYGLSGTAVLDVSEEISVAIHRKHLRDILLEADLVPAMQEDELEAELKRRAAKNIPLEKITVGLLPAKFSALLLQGITGLAHFLKHRVFKVTGTRGWNEAEFTAGGMDTREIEPGTLESKKQKGLYFAGEILDVNGRRGGFNLAWAWSSGFVAGAHAAQIP